MRKKIVNYLIKANKEDKQKKLIENMKQILNNARVELECGGKWNWNEDLQSCDEYIKMAICTLSKIDYKTDVRTWYQKLFGFCSCCGTWFNKRGSINKRRLNTAYVEESSNWIISCEDCFNEGLTYYQERWDDYHRGRY
jgi:hypothetical protein